MRRAGNEAESILHHMRVDLSCCGMSYTAIPCAGVHRRGGGSGECAAPYWDGPESTGCSFNKRCQVFFVGVNKIVFDDVPPLVIDEEVLLDCNECAVDCVTSSCLGTLSVARTDTGTVSSSSSVGRSFSAEVNPALGGSIGIEMEQSFVDGNSNSTSISHELSVECGSTSIPPGAHVRYWLKSYKNHRTACATFRYCGEAQYTADIACGTYAPGPWFWAGVCCDNQEAVDIDGQKGSGGLGCEAEQISCGTSTGPPDPQTNPVPCDPPGIAP